MHQSKDGNDRSGISRFGSPLVEGNSGLAAGFLASLSPSAPGAGVVDGIAVVGTAGAKLGNEEAAGVVTAGAGVVDAVGAKLGAGVTVDAGIVYGATGVLVAAEGVDAGTAAEALCGEGTAVPRFREPVFSCGTLGADKSGTCGATPLTVLPETPDVPEVPETLEMVCCASAARDDAADGEAVGTDVG